MDDFERPAEIEAIDEYVDAVLAGKKPPAGRVSAEKAGMLRMVALLNSVSARDSWPSAELAKLDQAGLALRTRRAWWDLRLTRRGLLGGLSAAIALLFAGVFSDEVLRRVRAPGPGAGWMPVANVAEVPSGAVKRFLAGDVEGHVLNREGNFSALSAICTHQPCVLNWATAEGVFVCPCHGAEFLPSGAQSAEDDYGLKLPPLASFPVEQSNGWLYVRV